MRLMAVYVSCMTVYWIFRREFAACESCGAAIASVWRVGMNLPELRQGRGLRSAKLGRRSLPAGIEDEERCGLL
jgi:hypothetical protein